MVKRTKKAAVKVGVTGRTFAYIQEVHGKKLGRPKTVMLTTVRVAGKRAPVRRRR